DWLRPSVTPVRARSKQKPLFLIIKRGASTFRLPYSFYDFLSLLFAHMLRMLLYLPYTRHTCYLHASVFHTHIPTGCPDKLSRSYPHADGLLTVCFASRYFIGLSPSRLLTYIQLARDTSFTALSRHCGRVAAPFRRRQLPNPYKIPLARKYKSI